MWENDYEIRNISYFGRGAELGFGGNRERDETTALPLLLLQSESEIWAICLDFLDKERRGQFF